MTRIGFVGAGRMGGPMVRQLADAGHDVRALGRSEAARVHVETLGAQSVSTLEEAGDKASVVIVCVFDDAQVRAVCLDGPLLESMPDGSTLVVHTTGSPRTAEAIANRANTHGVRVVDAALSGGPHDIANGTLTLFVGGDANSVAAIKPVLQCYGDPIQHVGAVGNGQRVKLVNNALFAAHIGLLSEAVRLGGQLGVDEPTLLSALPHASGNSRALTGVAARGSVAAFATAVGDFLDKDVSVVRETVAELRGNLGALDNAIDALSAG